MDEKVRDLIFQYFKMDILTELPLSNKMREDIIEVFTQIKNENLNIGSGPANFLTGTKFEELKNDIMEKNKGQYRPYPLKLGMLRMKLRSEACEQNISMQQYVISILRNRKRY